MNSAILLVLKLPQYDTIALKEEMNEMILLANTLSYNVVDVHIQSKNKIDSSTYFGRGKIESLKSILEELDIKILLINDELNPSHYKNISKICGKNITIIDRTQLILDIFGDHAKTKESKTQVKVAKLEYLLPRLSGLWTHLERQAGGTGTRGGPGEKQIEIDRRLIKRDLGKLKNDLRNIDKQRNTQRKSRSNIFKIAIAGYTNAGKS